MTKTTTKIELLPAINNLYNLNLSDKQIENIQKVRNKFETDKNFDGIDNVYYFEASDLSLSSIPVSYSDGQSVYLWKMPKNEDNKIRHSIEENFKKLTSKFKSGYVLCSNMDILSGSSIVINKLSLKDRNKLNAFKIWHKILSNHNINEFNKMLICNNMDEAIELLKKITLDNNNISKFNKTISPINTSPKLVMKVLELFWPEMLTTKTSFKDINPDLKEVFKNDHNLSLVTNVGEVNNTRFIIRNNKYIGEKSSKLPYYRYHHKDDNYLFIVPHTYTAYNYCDIENVFYYNHDNYYGVKQEHEEIAVAKLIFNSEIPVIPTSPEILLDYASSSEQVISGVPEIVEDSTIRTLIKRDMQRRLREDKEEKDKELLVKKANKKLEMLEDLSKTIKINDMVFNKNYIEYHGQKLVVGTESTWAKDILKLSLNYRSIKEVNFEDILQTFLAYICNRTDISEDGISGIIGEVSFNIKEVRNTNVNGITSKRYYLNGFRVNAAEIDKLVERGLCFETQQDYDSFIKSVSKCSLHFHRYLQLGVDISVMDNFDGSHISMKFPLERRKGKNFLVLGNNEFRITDTNKIIRLRRKHNIIDVITTLLDGSTVVGVEASHIKTIIDDAKKAFVDAVEKSKQLLKETEELFNLRADNYEIGGSKKYGYKIEGSLRTYFLANDIEYEKSNSCGVYDFHTGNYICIVDKSNSQVGMDKLVNRIFALQNDKLVANKITTLNRK